MKRLAIGSLSSLGLACLCAGHALASPQAYDELTNSYRSVTNFNVETTRGMVFGGDGSLLVLNTHGSLLNRHAGTIPPTNSWPTINNPIAVGAFSVRDGDVVRHFALVLGGGTHALCVHDLSNGQIVRTLQLPAETGDLVVDSQNERAFVSLPGNDTVLQIGLPNLVVQATFDVDGARPRFLSLDLGSDAADDNFVFVTPELSGNNSIPIPNPATGPTVVIPFSLDPFLPEGLPDEDLYRITPFSGAGNPTLSADAMLRNAGTILNAHGRNPVTGEYWIVGTDANNTLALDEPSLKGIFATNQVTIAPTLWSGTGPLPIAPASIDLDQVGGAFSSLWSCGSPYALEFYPNGSAIIAGSTSDRIRAIDAAGVRIGDLDLPPGSIPRDLLFDPSLLFFYVYCWGTNEVRAYDIGGVLSAMAADPNLIAGPTAGYLGSLPIGVDPTPAAIQRGRAHFYDASNSQDGRTTCNTCHPGGGMDVIGWSIQDFPHDHKDLMVTQSLKSIEDTFPYHWRGERDLEAFNAAFSGLLGGTNLDETPGGEFDDFKAFIFSLQVHANPNQDISRTLDPLRSTLQPSFSNPVGHIAGDPINGQALMDQPNTLFSRFSCADCHGKPTGSVGDPQADDATLIPGNANLDVAHFRQLTLKDRDIVPVTITINGTPTVFNLIRGGYGLTHDGNHPSVFDFLNGNPFTLNLQEEEDLAAFVEQADEGIAPSVHAAWTVDSTTSAATTNAIQTNLLNQSGASWTANHWVSVAVIGTHEDINGASFDLTWFYLGGNFFSSDPTVTFPNGTTGSQTWADLIGEARAGRARFTILGVPPGNALRFAHDRDNDLLSIFDELAAGTDPANPDSDGDGDPDGHEFSNGGTHLNSGAQANDTTAPGLVFFREDHMGASYAKLVLVYNEPVTLEITALNPVTGHTTVERRYVPRIWDAITVQRLEPSLPMVDYPTGYPIADVVGSPFPYSLSVVATDLSGNQTTTAGGAFTTRDQLVVNPFDLAVTGGTTTVPPAFLSRVIDTLDWVGTPGVGPVFQATATVQHRFAVPEVTAAYANPPLTPNGSAGPDDQQVVIAQVLHFDSVGGTWSVMDTSTTPLTISAPAGRIQPSIDWMTDGATPTAFPIDIVGPFLLSTTSGTNGTVTFDFTLSSALPPGDLVKLNVIGIAEKDTRDGVVPAQEFWGGSIASYNKPATKPENRGIVSP